MFLKLHETIFAVKKGRIVTFWNYFQMFLYLFIEKKNNRIRFKSVVIFIEMSRF